jgi:DNA-binding GntR family transcriptional regulator
MDQAQREKPFSSVREMGMQRRTGSAAKMSGELEIPSLLFADLDRGSKVPLHAQVSQRIESAIADGDLPAGSRLEGEVGLSERLGLSRPTMRRAIQVLVEKGLLVRRRGVGTQVVHGSITRHLKLSSLHDDLIQQGRSPRTKVLLHERVPLDPQISAEFEVSTPTPVLHIKRLRFADAVTVGILENYIFAGDDIDIPTLVEGGLYETLRKRGAVLRVSRQWVSARTATPTEEELLDLRSGSAILALRRITYDDSGNVVELANHLYRPDRYQIEFTLVDNESG